MKNSVITAFKMIEERYPEPLGTSEIRWKDIAAMMVDYAALPFTDRRTPLERMESRSEDEKERRIIDMALARIHDMTLPEKFALYGIPDDGFIPMGRDGKLIRLYIDGREEIVGTYKID